MSVLILLDIPTCVFAYSHPGVDRMSKDMSSLLQDGCTHARSLFYWLRAALHSFLVPQLLALHRLLVELAARVVFFLLLGEGGLSVYYIVLCFVMIHCTKLYSILI